MNTLHECPEPSVCFYHFPCLDGFAAALAVGIKWPEANLIPINYTPDMEQVITSVVDAFANDENKSVMFVDFFPGAELVETLTSSHKVVIFDHHKTAQEDMQLFFEAGIIEGTFDLERSGAGIAWDELHGADTRPDLINYIEDRDLWRFKYGEDTKTFHAFISSHPYDFGLWKQLMDETNMDLVFEQGGAIRRKHKKDVDEIIDQCLQWQTIQGHRVPVINIPYTHGSEAAAEMLRRYPDAPFAAYYCDAEGERRWGFRSQDHRVDVSEIAKNWGGGGHRNASGVIVPFVEPKVV